MTATAAQLRSVSPRLPAAVARDIVDLWRDPLLVLDHELHIAFANQSFCDWAGVSSRKVRGQVLDRFLGSARIPGLLRDAQAGLAARDVEADCEVAGLGKRALLINVNPLRPARHQQILMSIADVTDRQPGRSSPSRKAGTGAAQEAGQRREMALLRSIMESSGDGIFVADAQGNCILWNPACAHILGLNPETLRQEQWTEKIGIFLPDKVTPFPVEQLPLSRALRGEPCDEVELWIQNQAQPEGLWISVTARPLTGGHDGAVSTFRDVTFAKDMKDALAAEAGEVERSNHELEQFAYVAAHDLQEPLRMVSSYVQLLARRYQGKLDGEADEFIAFATEGAQRMSRLINDLLAYSRVGRGTISEETVDCEKVLEQVLFSLGQKSLAAGVTVTHDPLPKIVANELQISQLLQNLIDNAMKFRGNEDPQVHVSATPQGSTWVFSVADNGIGIEEQYWERIFVIFQRLNSREAYEGTGIGLSVCKKIVEKHGGKIWVESNQGKGTVVYFTWP
jgi:PAS domain S-box-containing protein